MKRYMFFLLALLASASCKDGSMPVVDEVWINMSAFPVGKVNHAYPDQTLCLYGSGFTGLRHIEVNGTVIDISSTFVYNTDRNITFLLPEDVNVSDAPENMYIKVVTSAGEYVYSPFLTRPSELKPDISEVSSTILVPGSELVVKGTNLDGAKEVYLPVTYGGKILCPFSEKNACTSEALYVVVPEADFATGQIEVVMDKYDEPCDFSFTEMLYSDIYDFIN